MLNDNELSYIRLNPRTHTPFGLGRVEVAFETINAFLERASLCGAAGFELGGAVCAVAAGSDTGTSRAADPVVAGRD